VIPHSFGLTTREHTVAGRPLMVVEVGGEVDVTSAQAFREAVADLAGPVPLVLDLSRLSYIDSAGFAALDGMLSRGMVTIVLGADAPIRAAADLVGLPCHGKVEDAVAAIEAR
jgi:anti-anti-sigma factor